MVVGIWVLKWWNFEAQLISTKIYSPGNLCVKMWNNTFYACKGTDD